jgi:alpha-galactosidase
MTTFVATIALLGAYAQEPTIEKLPSPAAPATPHINGPRVCGARPGHEFLYRVPCTGLRPIKFFAKKLPETLHLDPATGIVSGAPPHC